MLGAEFWFLAHSPRKWGWKAGLEGGAGQGGNQNFGILQFFIKGTSLKSDAGHFLFYATFWFHPPLGPRGTPQGQLGWKSNVKIYIEGTPTKIKI